MKAVLRFFAKPRKTFRHDTYEYPRITLTGIIAVLGLFLAATNTYFTHAHHRHGLRASVPTAYWDSEHISITADVLLQNTGDYPETVRRIYFAFPVDTLRREYVLLGDMRSTDAYVLGPKEAKVLTLNQPVPPSSIWPAWPQCKKMTTHLVDIVYEVVNVEGELLVQQRKLMMLVADSTGTIGRIGEPGEWVNLLFKDEASSVQTIPPEATGGRLVRTR